MHVLNANVHVHPVVVQDPVDTTVCQGDNATFTCVIVISSGSIPPIGWLRNGVNVDMIRHVETTSNNRTGNNASPAYIGGTVTVINVTSSDNGVRYQCGIVLFLSSNATLSVAGECIQMLIHTYICHDLNIYGCPYVYSGKSRETIGCSRPILKYRPILEMQMTDICIGVNALKMY